jgi:heme/copper-type cytochrome/quinol oxidase subunit 2
MNGVLIIVWLCAAAAVAVFAAMMISIATFDGRSGDCLRASARQKAAEMLWALIPIAIVLATAMPALRTTVFAGSGEAAHAGSQAVVALLHRPPPWPPAAVAHGP